MAKEEVEALTNDRVFEVAVHNGQRDTQLYYVVAYSGADAVCSLVKKLEALPHSEGWDLKDYFFTAESA